MAVDLEEPAARRPRRLILLLGLVVAGSSWQLAARRGSAEPGRAPLPPLPEAPAAAAPARAPTVSFKEGLGLARIDNETRAARRPWPEPIRRSVPDGAGEEKRRGTSVTSRFAARASSPPRMSGATPDPVERLPMREEPRPDVSNDAGTDPREDPGADLDSVGRETAPTVRGLARARAGAAQAGAADSAAAGEPEDLGELAALDVEDEEDDILDEEPLPEATVDSGSGDLQLVVIGPGAASRGETISFAIQVENAGEVAHSPLRVIFEPAVLEFVKAEEGSFLSSGGAITRFFARDGGAPGVVEIAISRMPPARGVAGSGHLCTLTFRAKGAGSSPIMLSGSSLLDSSGAKVAFRRSDADVAVE